VSWDPSPRVTIIVEALCLTVASQIKILCVHTAPHWTALDFTAYAAFLFLSGSALLSCQFACTGGGSNFGGLVFPILREKLAGKVRSGEHSPRLACQHSYVVLARSRFAGKPTAHPSTCVQTSLPCNLATAATHKAAVDLAIEVNTLG